MASRTSLTGSLRVVSACAFSPRTGGTSMTAPARIAAGVDEMRIRFEQRFFSQRAVLGIERTEETVGDLTQRGFVLDGDERRHAGFLRR